MTKIYDSMTVERLIPRRLHITEFPGFRLIEEENQRDGECGYGIKDVDYERLLKSAGSTDFLFEKFPDSSIERTDTVRGVTDEFLDSYLHVPQYSNEHYGDVDLRELVALEAFQNIVTDQTVDDGYLYDLDGAPVYRSFRVEMPIGYGYDVNAITISLRKYGFAIKPKKFGQGEIRLGDRRISPVPHYNRDSQGENTRFDFNSSKWIKYKPK